MDRRVEDTVEIARDRAESAKALLAWGATLLGIGVLATLGSLDRDVFTGTEITVAWGSLLTGAYYLATGIDRLNRARARLECEADAESVAAPPGRMADGWRRAVLWLWLLAAAGLLGWVLSRS